jgi:4'-phosphopantetheinyl transferase
MVTPSPNVKVFSRTFHYPITVMITLHAVPLDGAPDPALLAPDERERAARFVHDVHRRRFIVARAALRRILGAHLGVAPATLRFTEGAHGKPALDGTGLEFNLSHSHELALVAVTRDAPVGVDVEHLRPVADALGIARSHFAPSERAALAAAPADARDLVFLRGWTRKEAFIKAIGEGLSHPLDQFEVSLTDEARFLGIGGDPAAAARWSLFSFEPAPGYLGAVAAPVAPAALRWA